MNESLGFSTGRKGVADRRALQPPSRVLRDQRQEGAVALADEAVGLGSTAQHNVDPALHGEPQRARLVVLLPCKNSSSREARTEGSGNPSSSRPAGHCGDIPREALVGAQVQSLQSSYTVSLDEVLDW